MAASLRLSRVRHHRGGVEVLNVPALDIPAGEHLSVLGPNGAGKSTLLRLLAGVDAPGSGTVELDGVDTRTAGVELRRRVAYATQRPGLLSTSVRRNVELPLTWRKIPRDRRLELTTRALERLRVAELAERQAHRLSGGQQQRVNLARALAIEPALLLLDEPAAGLDAESRTSFFADLEDALSDRAATVVHVSHQTEEALRLADRVVVLVAGQVHQVGTPEDLLRRPADASVAALVGYDNLVPASVEADGRVRVGSAPSGLRSSRGAGPATVAVFANGIRLSSETGPGLPVRVIRVRPDRGRLAVTVVTEVGPLLVHVGVDEPAPEPGRSMRAELDPLLSAVLPESGAGG